MAERAVGEAGVPLSDVVDEDFNFADEEGTGSQP